MNPKIKNLLFLGTSTSLLIPLVAVSCGIVEQNGDAPDNKEPINNPDPNKKTNQTLNEPKFLVSEFFDNLKIKNDQNFTIDKWIETFHRDLGVDISKPFSFNRTSETEQINISNYEGSSLRILRIVNKYLSNSKKVFDNKLAYDIRATKKNDNQITLSVYIYNPNLTEDNLINQNFDLDFKYINPSKEYEKLIEPLDKANIQLEELKSIKDDATIKQDYERILNISAVANNLITKKVNDSNRIDEVLKQILESLANLENSKNILHSKQNIASLQVEISKQNTLLSSNYANESIRIIKEKADILRAKLSEAEQYIESGQTNQNQITEFKSQLANIAKNFEEAILDLNNKLNQFVTKFLSKIEIEKVEKSASRVLQIFPSQLKPENIVIRSSSQLEDAIVTFNISPHDSFGQVLIGANVRYGNLNRTIPPARFNRIFMSKTQLNTFFSSTFLSDSYAIIQERKWPQNNENLASTIASFNTIKEKLLEILDSTQTEDNVENIKIKRDRVATFLWALEYKRTGNKTESFNTIKNDFLDKKDSNSFSKLEYMTRITEATETNESVDFWESLVTFAKLISYAHTVPNTDENFSKLAEYRDTKLITFILGWWRDYFNSYYNSSIIASNNQWKLFEFIQINRSIKLYQILSRQLSINNTDKTNFFETLKHYAVSISEYGHVKNSISGLNKSLIYDPQLTNLAFVTRFFYVIENRSLDAAIKDAVDYKKWLEGINFEALYKILGSDSKKLLKYFETLAKQNQVFIILKENGSNFGLDFTNLDSIQKWFFEQYLAKEITFEKLNSENGEIYMSIIAAAYSMLKINPTAKDKFVKTLKENSVILNKQEASFTKLNNLNEEYKKIWKEIFLN